MLDPMRRTATVIAVALGLVTACTSKASGPTLWKRACEHQAKLSPGGAPLEQCMAGYRGYPTSVADDLARCALQDDTIPSPDSLKACLSADSRAVLLEQEQTQRLLIGYDAAIRAYEKEHGALPKTLADLDKGDVGPDAWGRPLIYERTTDTTFSLCSAGYDGQPRNDDDQCGGAFIYFEF